MVPPESAQPLSDRPYWPEEYQDAGLLPFETPLYFTAWQVFERLVQRNEAEVLVFREIPYTIKPDSAGVMLGDFGEIGVGVVNMHGHLQLVRSRQEYPTREVQEVLRQAAGGIVAGNHTRIHDQWRWALAGTHVRTPQFSPSHSLFYLAGIARDDFALPRGIHYGWKPRFTGAGLTVRVK